MDFYMDYHVAELVGKSVMCVFFYDIANKLLNEFSDLI